MQWDLYRRLSLDISADILLGERGMQRAYWEQTEAARFNDPREVA